MSEKFAWRRRDLRELRKPDEFRGILAALGPNESHHFTEDDVGDLLTMYYDLQRRFDVRLEIHREEVARLLDPQIEVQRIRAINRELTNAHNVLVVVVAKYQDANEALAKRVAAYENSEIRRSRPLADRPELETLLVAAVAAYERMSPEEKEAMHQAQRESWAKQDKD